MLIIMRKPGEAITIGSNIKVTVLSIQGKQVKLGISAPGKVEVHREEVSRKIQSEKMKSSMTLKEDIEEMARIIKSKKGKSR